MLDKLFILNIINQPYIMEQIILLSHFIQQQEKKHGTGEKVT